MSQEAWLSALGLSIRLARTRRGWTQAELGRRAGVSRVTVGSMERADHPASICAVQQVAHVLGMSLAELVAQADAEAAAAAPTPPLVVLKPTGTALE